ncbi:MAG: hypothetical protein JKY81_00410 [Colwellia sp.]|nr:hypothetical protein [Colwellia sp.]
MYPLKIFALIAVLLVVSPSSTAKKRCKPLLEKLQNIQAMQRHGYSAKRGISLRAREDKARDNWWQCEKGGGKKNKIKKKRVNKATNSSSKTKSVMNKKITAGTPFKTSNAIVIKSAYQGDKKRAWLAFYQQPKQCNRPKNLPMFAFCSEEKQTQQAEFEQQYYQ